MRLSVVYPCYCQQQTLRDHFDRWHSFGSDIREAVEFIIVDDHSRPAIEVPINWGYFNTRYQLNYKVFRVNQPIIWNYGAKNLGVQKASAPWVFLSELDHLLTEDALWGMLALTKGPVGQYYMFNREGKDKPHPATYLFHSSDFWDVGGIDEDFSGAYGHDDTYLVHCFERDKMKKVIPKTIELECLMGLPAPSDSELWRLKEVPRDLTRNTRLLEQKMKQRHISTSRIRFDWKLVDENRFIR